MPTTEQLYDKTANRWQRLAPACLSDFTGREALLESCEPVKNSVIADLGCGEGYCARALAELGAQHIDAFDISENMIARAEEQLHEQSAAICYKQADVRQLALQSEYYDLCIASFLFCYLPLAGCQAVFETAHQALKAGGRLIFTVPHPAFAFMKRAHTPPFYYDIKDANYLHSVDDIFEGEIFKRDGQALKVRAYHKTMSHYFELVRQSPFKQITEFKELGVEPRHLTMDADFFGPLIGLPLHLLIVLTKS